MSGGDGATPSKQGRAQAYVRKSWRYVELQFKGEVTHTRMLRWCPDVLLVGYTRTMLAALLLQPRPRRTGILGLGAGPRPSSAIAICLMPASRAVESDAGVLALREVFRVPVDAARLTVDHDDGARWLRGRRERYALLLVDA